MARRMPKNIGKALLAALILTIVVFFVYMEVGRYSANDTAQAALESDSQVTVYSQYGYQVFQGPDADPDNTYGLIFQQGAKVDSVAYAPLLHALAAKGWTCVLLDAPFDFAMLDSAGAAQPLQQLTEVEHWYVGGHSLGGVTASAFAADYKDQLDGVLLLAAYTSVDLSSTDLQVISVYGSLDGVLDKNAYANSASKLPSNFDELVIEGGNHAQFGDYGTQEGDGEATISASEQQKQTIEFFDECAKSGK